MSLKQIMDIRFGCKSPLKDFKLLLPVLDHIEQLNVTALVDIPWSAYGVELHEEYPHAKVIVTVRDKQSWFQGIRYSEFC